MDAPALLALAQTDGTLPLPPTSTPLATILSSPPFIHVPFSFNSRDLGLVPGSPIRPGLFFRTAGFSAPKPKPNPDPDQNTSSEAPFTTSTLRDALGGRVRYLVDLRTEGERVRRPDPDGDDGDEGVTAIWEPTAEGAPNAVDFALFAEGDGEKGFVEMYLGVLKYYAATIRRVLEAVRDGKGEEGVVFHCTAGRDRTGVVAGLLLSLAGASADTVALDYVLSRIGIEPAREMLEAALTSGGLGGAPSVEARHAGLKNLSNLRVRTWAAFVKALEAEHGGFEGYVKGALGFSDDDVRLIRRNLVGG
ncbi:protein-tyrosine phosphatase-like protein [Chaetomium sp. MPI-SDFR-AT-0129]|nr:protein-tyrosine phosphatase-like protein [Chaetomium sp. MPI-SDFR-AT-0129]